MPRAAVFGLLSLFLATGAQAAVSEDTLNRDYQACVGSGRDAALAAYCACIREGEAAWSEQEYQQVVLQTAAAKTLADTPPLLAALAKSCTIRSLGVSGR